MTCVCRDPENLRPLEFSDIKRKRVYIIGRKDQNATEKITLALIAGDGGGTDLAGQGFLRGLPMIDRAVARAQRAGGKNGGGDEVLGGFNRLQ